MQVSLQNFSTMVENMAAAVQGACSSLIDLTVGSVLRAVLEATASVALWLQYMVLQVLSMTRLATSTGSDVDSWVGDFGMTRLPAAGASGMVVMTSFNPSAQASTVPTGAIVRTSDGTQSFAVTGGPYVRTQEEASISVPVVATVAGTSGNIQAGLASVLGTAIAGIDTVTNPSAFTGGSAAETDAALRTRFISFMNTRAQATEQALGYAISSVQQGLTFAITENVTAAGTSLPGYVQVVVDDGSGSPEAALLQSIAAAIDLVRPVGVTVNVSGPVLQAASITVSITSDGSVTSSSLQTLISDALTTYINGLSVGQILRYSRIAGLCYDASSAVTNVQDVQLNGGSEDLGGAAGSVVRTGTINVVVST